MKIQNLLLIAIIISLTACGGDSENSVQTNITEETDPMSIYEDGIFYSSSEVKHEVYSSSTENTVPIVNISSSSARNNITYGTLMDERDGQVYKTVVIGNQTWMAENLNYQDSRLSNNKSLAGAQYTWGDAVDSAGLFSFSALKCKDFGADLEERCLMPDIVRGICPEGWHIPSRKEWGEMLSFISGGKYDWKQARIEDKIFKVLRSTSGWGPNDDVECTGYTLGLDTNGKSFSFCLSYTQNLNGSDLYGFSIYPDMYTEGLRYMSGFWLSNSFFYDSDPTTKGYSNNKAYEILSIVIKYREDTSNMYQGAQFLIVPGGVESVRCIQDDVTVQTAKSSSSAVSSSSVNNENEAKKNTFKDSRDGQIYKTVVIGSQTWMAQNLNYKTVKSFCYDKQDSNCTKYGRLYTWAAAMDSAGVFSLNGAGCGYNRATCSPTIPVRGVCPEGWHLPTKTEWDTLFSMVGSMSTAGRELKSASGWPRDATDAFGFSALPAGDYIGGYFGSLGEMAEFWSASEGDIDHAYSMVLWSTDDKAALREWPKDFGMSVRCLKD